MIKNKNTRQKLLSLALSGSVLVGNIPAAFALDGYNAVNASGKGQSAITLFVENSKEAILSATVPAELPIKMDLDGNITVPTNAAIVNTTPGKDIAVTDVHVELADSWKGAPYADDVYFQADDTQVMALRFRGEEMQKDGTIPVQSEQWIIGAGQELPLKMEARLPKQTVAGSKGKVATVSYTLDWAKKDTPPVSHVYTLTVLDGEHGTINDKSPIQTDENGVIQSFPNVTPDSGYVFDKWINAQTGDEIRVGDTLTADVNIQPVCKQADSEVTVEWENGLMIPGSGNRAWFSWETNDGEDALVKVESDNSAVAVCQRDLTTRASGGDLVYVKAKSRGVAHITGTMASGKTASFTVNVSELVNSETFESGSLQVEGKATIDGDVVSGDTLNVENLQVTVPVTQADGSTADAPITVTDIPTTPLQAGKNDISVSANVNGVEVRITLHIIAQYAQSETPVSIAVTKQPNKTNYIEGENFNSDGMEVTVTYADGHTAVKSSDFTVQDGENLAVDKTSVALFYSENGQTLQTVVPITVEEEQVDPSRMIDKTRMSSALKNLTGKISFSNVAYTGDDGIDISAGQNGSIKAVVNGNDAIIYQEGNVKAPVDSSSLFKEYKCAAIDCDNLDTRNVTDMSSIFHSCYRLASLDLSNVNTKNVTDMTCMFYDSNLISLNLSNFDTSKVTTMFSMFCKCNKLTSLDLSNFDTTNVTEMTYMFKGCSGLTSLDLSSFNTTNLKYKSYMFNDCNATVYVKNSAERSKLSACYCINESTAGCTFIIK